MNGKDLLLVGIGVAIGWLVVPMILSLVTSKSGGPKQQ